MTPKTQKPTRPRTDADLAIQAMAQDAGVVLDKKGQLPRWLSIGWRRIVDVRAYPNNPRINEDAIADVRDSLLTNNWTQPIVTDIDGVIIVGHTRYYAALDLKQTHVPVYEATHLTPELAAAYRLLDNKVHERSKWDYPKLKVELDALDNRGVPLKLTGFRPFEIEPIRAADFSRPAVETPQIGGSGPGGSETRLNDTEKDDREGLVFDPAQREIVLAAAAVFRKQAKQPGLDLAECVTRICERFVKAVEKLA